MLTLQVNPLMFMYFHCPFKAFSNSPTTAWQPYRLNNIAAFCINSSYSPKDQFLKILKIGVIENLSFFESAILIFFASSLLKSVTIYGVRRMRWNFDDYPDFHQKARGYNKVSLVCSVVLIKITQFHYEPEWEIWVGLCLGWNTT
jgi:hypothetical protein